MTIRTRKKEKTKNNSEKDYMTIDFNHGFKMWPFRHKPAVSERFLSWAIRILTLRQQRYGAQLPR